MRTTAHLTFAAVFLTCSLDLNSAVAARYESINVFDTTMTAPGGYSFSPGIFPASISGNETAFLWYYKGFNLKSIFRGNGHSLAPVVSTGDMTGKGPLVNIENPDFSNGNIAFVGYQQIYSPQGVYKASAGVITPIVESGDPAPSGTFQAFNYARDRFPYASISNETVAFRGVFSAGEGIFTGSGGPLMTIAKTGDPAPQFSFGSFGDPDIDGNNVAFFATYPRENGGIFIADGQSITTIAKTGDPAPSGTLRRFGDPTISGNTAAFVADYADGLTGIFAGSGGPLTTIVKEGDPAPVGAFNFPGSLPITPPAIAGDTVAFLAYFGDTTYQHQGIFVNRDGINSTVIQKGDPLFGSAVKSLYLGKSSLIADGTLAFTYSLEDSRQGIAFARIVPEPATGVLLAVVATILLAQRRTGGYRIENQL